MTIVSHEQASTLEHEDAVRMLRGMAAVVSDPRGRTDRPELGRDGSGARRAGRARGRIPSVFTHLGTLAGAVEGVRAETPLTASEYADRAIGFAPLLPSNTTGPHLHFEVRVDGAAYDPAPLLGLGDPLR